MSEMIDPKKTLDEVTGFHRRLAGLDEDIAAARAEIKDLRKQRRDVQGQLSELLDDAASGQGRLFNRKDSPATKPKKPPAKKKALPKRKAKAKKKQSRQESEWAKLTPEQRDERVRKMLQKRGLERKA